jgi:hypothetical protein
MQAWAIIGYGHDREVYMPTYGTIKVVDGPLEKQDIENLQCEKYQQLLAENFPSLNFCIKSIPDKDPPDFIATRGVEDFSLDMMAFALGERRAGNARLEQLRAELLKIFRAGGLRRCKGLMFTVQFEIVNNAGKLDIPKNLRQVAPRLAAAFSEMTAFPEPSLRYPMTNAEHLRRLQEFQADFYRRNSDFAPPYSLEKGGVISDFGLRWYVAGVILRPKNDFEIETGFGVEFNFNQSLDLAGIKGLLDNAIASHDKPEQRIDELVVIAGGPNRQGEASNDESVFVEAFFDKGLKIEPPKNLKRVAVIDWLKKRIWLAYGFSGENALADSNE